MVVRMRERGLKPTGCDAAIRAMVKVEFALMFADHGMETTYCWPIWFFLQQSWILGRSVKP